MATEIPIQSANSLLDVTRQSQSLAVAKNKQEKVSADQVKESVNSIAPDKIQSKQESEPVQLSKEQVQAAVNKLKEYAETYKRNIRFSVDEYSGRTIVKLLDSENNVLRQIPSEELLDLVKSIEQNKGLLLVDEA